MESLDAWGVSFFVPVWLALQAQPETGEELPGENGLRPIQIGVKANAFDKSRVICRAELLRQLPGSP